MWRMERNSTKTRYSVVEVFVKRIFLCCIPCEPWKLDPALPCGKHEQTKKRTSNEIALSGAFPRLAAPLLLPSPLHTFRHNGSGVTVRGAACASMALAKINIFNDRPRVNLPRASRSLIVGATH